MKFKPGDRVWARELAFKNREKRKATVIDATVTAHKDKYGTLGLRFDDTKYDKDNFHLMSHFELEPVSKLHEVLE